MRKKLNHTILAEGEHTGHAHRASGGTLYADEADLFWETKREESVTHEEHDAQTIPPSPTGEYQIGGVIEFDPFENEARRVAD